MEGTQRANLIITLLFGLALAVLAAGNLVGPLVEGKPLVEKRELARRPTMSLDPFSAYPEAWEAWFNDHFAYRATMVRLNNLLRLRLFMTSDVSRVLPGHQGWLYYDGRDDRGGDPRANYLGTLPAHHEKLFAGLKGQLEHTRNYFEDQGVDYLLVVVPDKWTVYSDHLPGSVGPGAERTSADQFLEYLAESSDLAVLDLKETLQNAAAEGAPVFHRLDTHWNDTGALAAARAILKNLEYLGVMMPEPNDFRAVDRTRREGNLAEMLGLEDWLSERETIWQPVNPSRLEITDWPGAPEFPNTHRHPVSTRQDAPGAPKAMILRDSSGDALVPFLGRGFSEALFLWTSNARHRRIQPYIDELKPDLVIELRVEKLMLDPVRYFLAPGWKAISNHPGRKGRNQPNEEK